MPRATYDDGYEDGYADAQNEGGGSNFTLNDIQDDVERNLRKLRMGYTLDLTFREFLEDLERRLDG